MRGRIIRGLGGLYSVVPEEPDGVRAGDDASEYLCNARSAHSPEYLCNVRSARCSEYLCSARGIFRLEGKKPLVGDFVDFERDPIRPGYGNVVRIHPRRSELRRPEVANVDQLLIVLTLSTPEPDFMLADKLIVHALSGGITPALCFNKSDLPAAAAYADEPEGYERAGFLTIYTAHGDVTSAATADVTLAAATANRVTILAGQSGVGKSTLFNGLAESRSMPVGDMSRRIARGRHTTRHAELTALRGGGWLVDSPGFSAFDGEPGDYRGLDRYYPEFAPYLGQCRFKECSHIHEPDCAVREALGAGALHAGRHARYAALYAAYRLADTRKYRKHQ